MHSIPSNGLRKSGNSNKILEDFVKRTRNRFEFSPELNSMMILEQNDFEFSNLTFEKKLTTILHLIETGFEKL